MPLVREIVVRACDGWGHECVTENCFLILFFTPTDGPPLPRHPFGTGAIISVPLPEKGQGASPFARRWEQQTQPARLPLAPPLWTCPIRAPRRGEVFPRPRDRFSGHSRLASIRLRRSRPSVPTHPRRAPGGSSLAPPGPAEAVPTPHSNEPDPGTGHKLMRNKDRAKLPFARRRETSKSGPVKSKPPSQAAQCRFDGSIQLG